MKINFILTAITVLFILQSFSQSPNIGYVRLDTDGTVRSVLNLDVDQYTGTDLEIADQFHSANISWICCNENGYYSYLSTFSNPSGNHFYYIQKINTIPVIGSELVISVNSQHHISHVYNGYKKNISINTNPSITSEQAQIIAETSLINSNQGSLLQCNSELSILKDETGGHLVWKLIIQPCLSPLNSWT